MIYLIECFRQFDVCSSKISYIISMDHLDFPSFDNESSQCQYEAASAHAVCMLSVSICADILDIHVNIAS